MVRACARMAVDVTVVHRPVEKAAGNVQEAARDARREAALAAAAENDCGRIVLGHTADDQVETMLYRLGRYGGLAAFAGMLPNDPPWVRPLLGCRREETAAYCRDQGLEFAEDRGNVYPGYARTAIRETVLPAWEAGLPGAVNAACRAAEVAAEIERVVAGVLGRRGAAGGGAEAGGRWRVEHRGALGFGACGAEVAVACMVEAREACGLARRGLAVESLLDRPGSAERALGGGWWACGKEYDCVFLEQGPRQGPSRARSGAATLAG